MTHTLKSSLFLLRPRPVIPLYHTFPSRTGSVSTSSLSFLRRHQPWGHLGASVVFTTTQGKCIYYPYLVKLNLEFLRTIRTF